MPIQQHMGEIFSSALPTEDPVLYGTADITPKGAFEARSFQTFTLTYKTGRYGLDDTGSIKVVFRFTADGGAMQTEDPTAPNYVTAVSSNGVPLTVSFDFSGHVRPWYQALTVMVSKGCLREGDTVTLVVGDTSGGSPGYRVQSMCESEFTWRVIADVCATGHYVPIAESPTIAVVPGPPAVWKAVLPTMRRPGEAFRLGIKAEDAHGNPSDQVDATVRLKPSIAVNGLPETVSLKPGQRSLTVDSLSITNVDTGGDVTLQITLEDHNGAALAITNPLIIRDGALAEYWGDMHGQSGESVGLNTAREYFTFARDMAFLDATSHQANDFQINSAFWGHVNALTAEYHEDGRFLTVPGYEWSGNTGVGGDRNVYFRHEGRIIRRSSHALIADRKEIDTDSPTARQLFEDLAANEEDVVVYAHIGGRPADVAYAHDARLETAMEIHSAWGTFEWLMEDCFREGYRVGVVTNSDGHKGRPGASYPGASKFGAYGGITCFLMRELTRDAWFDCLRNRRHYATTGDRIHIDLAVEGDFERYDADPLAYPQASASPAQRLGMGDIARSNGDTATMKATVHARAPIERIDVMRGMEILETIRNPAPIKGRGRLRVLWRGAMVKGRGARADWKGRASFQGCEILRTQEINAWNPDRPLVQSEPAVLEWDSVTAGNFGAFDVWLEESDNAEVEIETNHATARFELSEIGSEDVVIPAGGLDLEVKLCRLPEEMAAGPLTVDVDIPVMDEGDTPIWIRVTTEDGFQAWTSPVYLFRN